MLKLGIKPLELVFLLYSLTWFFKFGSITFVNPASIIVALPPDLTNWSYIYWFSVGVLGLSKELSHLNLFLFFWINSLPWAFKV